MICLPTLIHNTLKTTPKKFSECAYMFVPMIYSFKRDYVFMG